MTDMWDMGDNPDAAISAMETGDGYCDDGWTPLLNQAALVGHGVDSDDGGYGR